MVELQQWDGIARAELDRMARADRAAGVLPILVLIDPSGDVRVISPLERAPTAALLEAVHRQLANQELQ